MREHFPRHNRCHFLELWRFVLKLVLWNAKPAGQPVALRVTDDVKPSVQQATMHPYISNTLGKYTCLKYDALMSSHDRTWVTFDLALGWKFGQNSPLSQQQDHNVLALEIWLYVCFSLSLWSFTEHNELYGLAALPLIIHSDRYMTCM